MPARKKAVGQTVQGETWSTKASHRIGAFTAVACASAVLNGFFKEKNDGDQTDLTDQIHPTEKTPYREPEHPETAGEFHRLQKKLSGLTVDVRQNGSYDPTLTGEEAVRTKLAMLQILIWEKRDLGPVLYDRLLREIVEDVDVLRKTHPDFAQVCEKQLSSIRKSAGEGLYSALDDLPERRSETHPADPRTDVPDLKNSTNPPTPQPMSWTPQPTSWAALSDVMDHPKIKDIIITRAPRVQFAYEEHKRSFDSKKDSNKFESFADFVSHADGLRKAIFERDARFFPRMVLEENRFPYYLDPRIVHSVLWFHPERMSGQEVDRFLADSRSKNSRANNTDEQILEQGDVDLSDRSCVWWENGLEDRSVADLRHIQVFERVVSNFVGVHWAVDR